MPMLPSVKGIFRTDFRARAAYAEGAGIYRIVPAGVCIPRDIEDLQALIRWAAASRTPLVPRSAGSAMGGGNVGDGVIVDLTRMEPRCLRVSIDSSTAISSSWHTLQELGAAAAVHGLRLPPNPSSAAWATVGGAISTNAAGPRSFRYGSVRRWVRSISLVTADGELVVLGRTVAVQPSHCAATRRFYSQAEPAIRASAQLIEHRFPRTRKNSSGYALDAYLESGDVLDLIIGSEGTLGFITEVEWSLDAIPPHRAGMRIALRSLSALTDVLEHLQALDPSSIELLDQSFLQLIEARQDGVEAQLLIELEGAEPEDVAARVARAAVVIEPLAARVETALTSADEASLWSIRHAASPILAALPADRRSLQVIEDACVPVRSIGEYIAFLRRAAEDRGLQAVIFGHAGDGNVHVNLLPELAREGWERNVAGLLDDVTGEVIRLGGTISGEHGDGRLRAGLLERQYGYDIVRLFELVKDAFDPLGILNPGVILPLAGDRPIQRLKAGRNAITLPPDIAELLRRIEQTAAYATDRLAAADHPNP